MPISRKRKQHVVDEELPSSKQTAMERFAGVSKEHAAGSKKQKTTHQREATPPAITMTKPTLAKADKKRKRQLESVAEDDEEDTTEEQKPRIFKQFAKKTDASTPRTKRFKSALPPSPVDTPSKSATVLFDKLKLDASSIPFPLVNGPAEYDTPPGTPELQAGKDLSWPNELQDLCQVHAAFLSALSMYYAHNGTTSPVNVGTLLPMITKNWKKRTVSLEDLRGLLAVQLRGQPDFLLEDGGRAGVCLSRAQPRGRALKRAASYIDEDDLNGRFEEVLQASWLKWQMAAQKENHNPATFIAQLPLIEITKSASAENASPLFARGQQRLADIKAAQATVLPASNTPLASAIAEPKTSQAVQNRSMSLLDRVLARQALTSSLPAGPTKQQLERKAALHRIEDIARMLCLLVGAKPRVTLSMQAMVQQLQQSLRNPISREEVERCIELMAGEITPGFVSVVVSGTVRGVVVRREGKVDVGELRARIESARA